MNILFLLSGVNYDCVFCSCIYNYLFINFHKNMGGYMLMLIRQFCGIYVKYNIYLSNTTKLSLSHGMIFMTKTYLELENVNFQ